ncbi:IclR family transcriptional regulator [Alkalibacter rhizosphaerae]|uniref:IclR family transcriptional regulator n=1 Tax=Alkalibacter rhizosphaerae TaxID=2815577 RepID=A0A974XG51_9FIRM|nr:IclR family transcriptional regulator [Alkalibacter rhizosphaerae]QSX09193.1 IclR family transcriptional regulator [Alkalibacter rhizosphaerae]
MSEKNPVQSAGRIFSVLEMLAYEGPQGVTELSKALKLNKSTVHRLLASLITMDYVKKEDDSDKYRLTFKLLGLGEALLDKVDIVSIARPYIQHLAEFSEETVHLVQKEGTNMVYIDKVESYSSSVRMVSRIGVEKPLYCTAVGKAMLAELTNQEVRQIWEKSDIQKLTPKTIVDFDDFLRELDEVREKGYALDNEENELGVRCIGAVIKNYKGKAENAFSISAPISRMSDQRIDLLATEVLKMKKELSRAFGFFRQEDRHAIDI